LPTFVPRVSTPIALSQVPNHIQAAFQAIGAPITPTQRQNLAVLVALETAKGSAMMNRNPGNITAGASYGGLAWRPPWFDPAEAAAKGERYVKLHAAMLAGKAPSAFRAYQSLADGFRDFAAVLRRNFPEVLEAAKTADAVRFRDALAQKYSHDYATAEHAKTIAALQAELGLTPAAAAAGGLAGTVVLGAIVYGLWRWSRTLKVRRARS
jgi:S-formylglutathione hydrolase FrmB